MVQNISMYFMQQEDVFIRNRTKPLGILSLALGEKNDISFPVPKNTLPINLTNYVPKEQIVKSTSFRQMVQKGAIELLSEEQYNMLIGKKVENAQKADEEVNKLISRTPIAPAPTTQEQESENEPEINSRVLQLMHNLSIDDPDLAGAKPSEESVIDELETLDLTEDDHSYIMTHSSGKVKAWVKGQMYGTEDASEDESEEAETEEVAKPKKRGRKKGKK